MINVYTPFLKVLENGDLVIIPTETVYGLAADATCDRAVSNIYTLKNRPTFNPLILHVSDVDMALRYCDNAPYFEKLTHILWNIQKKSISFVMPLKTNAGVSKLATAGLETVAVRMPQHPLTQELIKMFDKPLAAPSANPSNKISPTTPDHVRTFYGDKTPPLMDGGPCAVGLESTILDLTQNTPTILRQGAVTKSDIEAILNIEVLESANQKTIKAPGMQKRHYAPDCAVILNTNNQTPDGYVRLGFGPDPIDAPSTLNLSKTGDLKEAATHLFEFLHQLNNQNPCGICVAPIPNYGLGCAINDRLNRAATKA